MPYATKRWQSEDRVWFVDCYGTVRLARAGAKIAKGPYVLSILGEPEPPEPPIDPEPEP